MLSENELTPLWEDVYLIKHKALLAERLKTAQLIESQWSIKLRFITNSDKELQTQINSSRSERNSLETCGTTPVLCVFILYSQRLDTGHEYLMRKFMIDSLYLSNSLHHSKSDIAALILWMNWFFKTHSYKHYKWKKVKHYSVGPF